MANADQLFERAILGWGKPDREGAPNIDALYRFLALVVTPDRRAMRAKLTVQEIVDGTTPNGLHMVEAVEFNDAKPADPWVREAARDDALGIGKESPLRGEWAAEIAGSEDQALKPALYGFRLTEPVNRAAGVIPNLAGDGRHLNAGDDDIRHSVEPHTVDAIRAVIEAACWPGHAPGRETWARLELNHTGRASHHREPRRREDRTVAWSDRRDGC
ncbi:hypothetical protein LPC08_22720 [Roseomonas sp. OT10]|uniref:hypothetical protein n=1 Tax=Roseomonas cutis TaxID=2897332 RepID=UPI001E5E9323|nr:hypothetical protein [Roseomonas sp. OT10]UFN48782.1 hypothetical protein LPC08_22720 [Roseomonas sp. OT10]